MASFWTDDESLSVGVDLDTEHPDLDLTDGLGDELLELAINGMVGAVISGRAPSGERWPPNAEGTKRQKGHGMTGYRTGRMLETSNWTGGERDVQPRQAVWTYAGPDYARYFHAGVPERGQPPRGLVGWTAQAEVRARELINRADWSLRG